MADRYSIKISVISQKGHCSAGHRVGDQWIIDSKTIQAPAGMCLHALHALHSNIITLRFGGIFPYEDDPDTASTACPDSGNPCIFELRRLHEQKATDK
jgi:uncharacterized repeat protein (TIGR04076 family)